MMYRLLLALFLIVGCFEAAARNVQPIQEREKNIAKCYSNSEREEAKNILFRTRQLLNEARLLSATFPESEERKKREESYAIMEAELKKDEAALQNKCLGDFAENAAKRYVSEIEARIEHCGLENFPAKDGKKLYGAGEFAILFDLRGRFINKAIVKTSGVQELDEHILKLIDASLPFGPVPTQIHENKYSRFVIRRTFNFTNNDGELQPPPKRRCQFDRSGNR